jgi:hypothetical protein
MSARRVTFAISSLGLAVLIGWLWAGGVPGEGFTRGGQAAEKPAVQTAHTHSPEQYPAPTHHPSRRRTEPDPTPDDSWPTSVAHQDNQGSDFAIQEAESWNWVSLFSSRSVGWSQPARHDPVLLLTGRFRC